MKRSLGAVFAALALTTCADATSRTALTPDPTSPVPQTRVVESGSTARSLGVIGKADGEMARIAPESASRALAAFRMSCPALLRREDLSGLTIASDWQAACDAALTANAADAPSFFRQWFTPVQIGDGAAFATGYYEPEIAGSRTPAPGFGVPVYAKPPDLIEVDLGRFDDGLKGKRVSGRVEGGMLLPYADRAAIEDGALVGRSLEIGWVADPVELFFLQVQGSGRLRLPDGNVMRLGYAGQNGRAYTSIGGLMRERGLIKPGQLSMQGLMAYLHAHPVEARAIMRENSSFVFFRELTEDGPVGALGVAVTPRSTVAADPMFVPLGAPVLLATDRSEASGLWIAQDTGGAIRGPNRFDTFWGAGAEARTIAGGMSASGTALILLPKGAAARAASDGQTPRP